MAKKKLLSEAQVRRFMSLSGIRPLAEGGMGGMYEDEPAADAEMPPAEMEDETEDAEMAPEPAGEAEDEKTVSAEEIEEIGKKLEDALEFMAGLGFEGGASAKMDAPEMDAPEMDAPKMDDDEDVLEEDVLEEDELDEDILEEVELELTEDEIVQEVAKRVSRRILKAKNAKKALDEALGNK